VTVAVVSFLGWGLLAILERITVRARLTWYIVAVIGLVLSLGAPLSGTGVTAGDRIVLVLMHLTTGAVLFSGFARTVGRRT